MATGSFSNTHPALRYCWHPVARSSDVGSAPVRVLLLGEPWVLARLSTSSPGHAPAQVHAYLDRCPHRQAPLSLGSVVAAPGGGTATVLQCAYHGWCYGADGRCVDIPALGPGATIPPKARLVPAAGVEERHGMIFLRPEAPPPDIAHALSGLGSLPDIDEALDPRFVQGDLPVLHARASAGYLADNFLDMAHFPFVHAKTFGATERVVPSLSVERDADDPVRRWSFLAASEHPFLNREDPGVASGIRPLEQRRRITYRVGAPFHLVLRLDFVDAGGTNVIGFFLQPEAEDSSRIYSSIWRDDMTGDAKRLADAVAFEVSVVLEDLCVQESYDVLALPLTATSEVHTRADRATLELRRMLADLAQVVAPSTSLAPG